LEIEDFMSVGQEVLVTAKETWSPDKNAKFNTYFTMLLKRKFYKMMCATHRKKRGGAGSKEDDLRFGRSERWENGEAEKEVAQHVSIESPSGYDDKTGPLEIAVQTSNDAEYGILEKQVEKHLPESLRAVFRQMVNPDTELIERALTNAKNKNTCQIDTKMMAEYLGMDVASLRVAKRKVQELVAKQLGVAT
jgi:hypothetical protein